MAYKKHRSDCPVNFALEIFGDQWTLLIVRDLMFKDRHYYMELLNAEEKISTNILADRLAMLEQEGIVQKFNDPASGSKYIYKLSTKGIDLLPMMVEMMLWSARHDKHSAIEKKFVKQARADKAGLIKEITNKLRKELRMDN